MSLRIIIAGEIAGRLIDVVIVNVVCEFYFLDRTFLRKSNVKCLPCRLTWRLQSRINFAPILDT